MCVGGKVYLACRSLERARVAAEDIKQRTGVDDGRLVVMQLDLSSLSSVRSFASSFKTSNYTTQLVLVSRQSVNR